MKNNKNKKNFDIPEKKEMDFVKCPTHGIRHPKGSTCPMCAAGK